MNIELSHSCPFDLDSTLCCGQSFRWKKRSGWWYGVVGEKVFRIRQTMNGLEFENTDVSFVRNYFGLHDELPKIYSQIIKDEHIKSAIEKFKGLRILRQDPWECLISYICATYKNIPAISQMLLNLSRKFGERAAFEGHCFYTFPTPAKLAEASLKELAECSLGYRSKYVSETARRVHDGSFEIEHLRRENYKTAKCELLTLPGVGRKVADCVLLFSLEKLEAFPIDIWIKRVLLKYYANNFPCDLVDKIRGRKSISSSEYEKLNLFGRTYFGEYAGYAQEYLYHYERTENV